MRQSEHTKGSAPRGTLADVGHLSNIIDAVAGVECSRDHEYALVGGINKLIADVFNIVIVTHFS